MVWWSVGGLWVGLWGHPGPFWDSPGALESLQTASWEPPGSPKMAPNGPTNPPKTPQHSTKPPNGTPKQPPSTPTHPLTPPSHLAPNSNSNGCGAKSGPFLGLFSVKSGPGAFWASPPSVQWGSDGCGATQHSWGVWLVQMGWWFGGLVPPQTEFRDQTWPKFDPQNTQLWPQDGHRWPREVPHDASTPSPPPPHTPRASPRAWWAKVVVVVHPSPSPQTDLVPAQVRGLHAVGSLPTSPHRSAAPLCTRRPHSQPCTSIAAASSAVPVAY